MPPGLVVTRHGVPFSIDQLERLDDVVPAPMIASAPARPSFIATREGFLRRRFYSEHGRRCRRSPF